MADNNMQLNWTDEQWNKVRQVVYEEARKARVAGNILPLYGPLEPDATYVTKESLADPGKANDQGGGVSGFTVTDSEVVRLTTLQAKIYLKGAQVADPELTSALIAFRRAANIVARLEDEIVFGGQPGPGQRASRVPVIGALPTERNTPGEIIGGEKTDGLLPLDEDGKLVESERSVIPVPKPDVSKPPGQKGKGQKGKDQQPPDEPQVSDNDAVVGAALVGAVSEAIAQLEEKNHLGPFACILGHDYFRAVQTPQPASLVLPQDRILPFLGGGALLRTSTLPHASGVVVALGGEPIDLVVATDISVKFLQVTVDPWFVFRVYEKIALRIKQPEAIAVLVPK